MGRRRGVDGSAVSTTATTPTTVPVSSIAHSPRNPRESYEDVTELAASIEQVGVLQPLGVVRHELYLARYPQYEAEVGAAHWVVIQGNRRLAAAHDAQLDEVPVVVQERLAREDTFDETTLIENVHRADLSPLREAALLQELIDKHGSGRKVAKAVGKTSGWVTQRLSLLKLVPQLQAMLSSRELSIAAGRELAQIPQSRQLAAYENGEPYRDPAQAPPEPASGVDLDDRATYQRAELPPEGAYDVSTRSSSSNGSRGNKHPRKEGHDGQQSAYDVSTPATTGANGDGGGEVSISSAPNPEFSSGPGRLPAAPAELVAAIDQEYTIEQRHEVLRLMQQQ